MEVRKKKRKQSAKYNFRQSRRRKKVLQKQLSRYVLDNWNPPTEIVDELKKRKAKNK